MRFRLFDLAHLVIWVFLFAMSGCGGTGGVSSTPPSSSAANASLRIQGQPASVIAVGQPYSFQPLVDGGGTGLIYSSANLPEWLSLDTRTGRITGTPSPANVGTYSGLTVSVSDGGSTTSFGPFSITVASAGSGRATLSWMPPSANTDGSALTDLAGFVVLYGNSPTELSHSISVSNPSISMYVVESLTPGTWYFAVQAVNAVGVRSESSAMASKVVS